MKAGMGWLGGDMVCLGEADECDGKWDVGEFFGVGKVNGSVWFVFEVPGVEWCVVGVVVTDVLEWLAGVQEVVVSFMRFIADRAIVVSCKVGCL